MLARVSRIQFCPRTLSALGLMGTSMRTQSYVVATKECRRYRRYIVDGFVTLDCVLGETTGTLLNLGQGGILVKVAGKYRAGMFLSLKIQVENFPELLEAFGRVVGIKHDYVAIHYIEEPAGLKLLLNWLEQENCTWSGLESVG